MQNNINLSSRIKLLFVMILAVASINLLLVFNSQRKAILKPVSFNTIEILNNTFFVNESKLQSEIKIKNHLLPFIFIGGYARSGTTLMVFEFSKYNNFFYIYLHSLFIREHF